MNRHPDTRQRLKRRLDDLRYLPSDLRRGLSSRRERLLSSWAGSSIIQRLSSLGLAAAIVAALVVVMIGSSVSDDGVVVADDRPLPSAAVTTSNLFPHSDSTGAPASEGLPPLSVAITQPDTTEAEAEADVDVEVMGTSTVPSRSAMNSLPASRSGLSLFIPNLAQAPSQSGGSPATTAAPDPVAPRPTTAPATAPPATAPPATAPPATAPPVTTPPPTDPPVTVPPTTDPPVTTPPATDPPVTTPIEALIETVTKINRNGNRRRT